MDTVCSRDGTRIAYEVSGTGPALVLVNGALAERSAYARLRPLLDAHFTLFAYDRRGRGASGDTLPYAPERELEDLEAVVEAAGAPAFVFAHSGGAILALRAAMRGVAIRRLAVNEPPYMLPGTRPIPPREISKRIAERLTASDREGALRLFMVEQVGLPAPAFEQLKASPAWPSMVELAHTAAYDSEMSVDSALPVAELAQLSIPILVLNGTASFPWLAETARALVAALPNAQAAHLEGQPHSPAPEVLAPALLRFFV